MLGIDREQGCEQQGRTARCGMKRRGWYKQTFLLPVLYSRDLPPLCRPLKPNPKQRSLLVSA